MQQWPRETKTRKAKLREQRNVVDIFIGRHELEISSAEPLVWYVQISSTSATYHAYTQSKSTLNVIHKQPRKQQQQQQQQQRRRRRRYQFPGNGTNN